MTVFPHAAGGLYVVGSVSTNITDLVIANCTAGGSGGGVFLDGECDMSGGTTFQSNTARLGAGLYVRTTASLRACEGCQFHGLIKCWRHLRRFCSKCKYFACNLFVQYCILLRRGRLHQVGHSRRGKELVCDECSVLRSRCVITLTSGRTWTVTNNS